jgi:hypothetical protein
MVRIRRIAWISALLVFIAGLFVRVTVSLQDPGQGVFGAVFLGFGYVLLFTLLVLVIGLLVAVLPSASRERFRRRLWLRLPFALVISVVIVSVAAYLPEWWEGKHRMNSFCDRPYMEVPIASEADCARVHDGVFSNEGIRIERHGTRQVQRDKILGIEEEVIVSWPSPCEYILHSPSGMKAFVKITNVDSMGYDCVVYMGRDDDAGYATRLQRES